MVHTIFREDKIHVSWTPQAKNKPRMDLNVPNVSWNFFIQQQGMIIGVDIVGEDKMDNLMSSINGKETKAPEKAGEEVKMEDGEAQPHWEGDEPTKEPTEINRRRLLHRRLHFVFILWVVMHDKFNI